MKPPYLLEKKLPIHIKKYMKSHPTVDVGELTDDLMKNYRQYQRKSRPLFMKSVIKAYQYQLYRKGIDPSKMKMFFEDEDYRLRNIVPENLTNGNDGPSDAKKAKISGPDDSAENGPPAAQLYTLELFDGIQQCNFVYQKQSLHMKLLPIMLSGTQRNFLISGPSKSGKTMLVKALAAELHNNILRTSIIHISSAEISEPIKHLFKIVEAKQPCVFLIEFGCLFDQGDNADKSNDLKKYMTEIFNCIKELKQRLANVFIFIEISHPDILDTEFRMFFSEFDIPPLTSEGRLLLLKKLCANYNCSEKMMKIVANNTPGYVAGDLAKLISIVLGNSYSKLNSAQLTNLKSTGDNISNYMCKLQLEDFDKCIVNFIPTLMAEGFPSVSKTSLNEIGGLNDVKEILRIKISMKVDRFSIKSQKQQSGILLWGPPGCGKTMLARAIANETHINFLSISSAELLNKYVGETERNIRSVFERASKVTPCIVFFDEFDAMCQRRSKNSEGGSHFTIVNTLLAKMQGAEGRKGVFIMATTNRPDILDPAVLRPGRFDTIVYVGLPNYEERLKVYQALLRKQQGRLADDVNLEELAQKSDGFSPADCMKLCNEAGLKFADQFLQSVHLPSEDIYEDPVQMFNNMNRKYSKELPKHILYRHHFMSAFDNVTPSVSREDVARYMKMGRKINSVNLKFSNEEKEQKINLNSQINNTEEADTDEMDLCMF